MVSFVSEYIAGAHPDVLRRIVETNLECLPGYGADKYTEAAKEKIIRELGVDADVEFIAGGTQTNAVVISTMLRDYEGVVAAESGHISAHEAGAIEYTGHEVLTIPGHEGKIDPGELKEYLSAFFADPNHEHMTFPGMVYISHPTEYGTLYSKAELTEISGICRGYGIPLFLDGARLGYGLMSRRADLTLRDVAELCDVFYIGGTKVGALCGEAVVFTRGNTPPHFMTSVKKRGALLAKGRLLGVQFDALFTDGLYMRIGKHGAEAAERVKNIFLSHGFELFIDSPTNQQFVILEDGYMKKLGRYVAFDFWEKPDDGHTVVRFATSWSTTESDIEGLEKAIEDTL
ncbi:MAG: low specificity L-threonine aldolase [Clostridia bacterium]|nr:low specificity L-threonine aldolase [Clostridia bacterium]